MRKPSTVLERLWAGSRSADCSMFILSVCDTVSCKQWKNILSTISNDPTSNPWSIFADFVTIFASCTTEQVVSTSHNSSVCGECGPGSFGRLIGYGLLAWYFKPPLLIQPAVEIPLSEAAFWRVVSNLVSESNGPLRLALHEVLRLTGEKLTEGTCACPLGEFSRQIKTRFLLDGALIDSVLSSFMDGLAPGIRRPTSVDPLAFATRVILLASVRVAASDQGFIGEALQSSFVALGSTNLGAQNGSSDEVRSPKSHHHRPTHSAKHASTPLLDRQAVVSLVRILRSVLSAKYLQEYQWAATRSPAAFSDCPIDGVSRTPQFQEESVLLQIMKRLFVAESDNEHLLYRIPDVKGEATFSFDEDEEDFFGLNDGSSSSEEETSKKKHRERESAREDEPSGTDQNNQDDQEQDTGRDHGRSGGSILDVFGGSETSSEEEREMRRNEPQSSGGPKSSGESKSPGKQKSPKGQNFPSLPQTHGRRAASRSGGPTTSAPSAGLGSAYESVSGLFYTYKLSSIRVKHIDRRKAVALIKPLRKNKNGDTSTGSGSVSESETRDASSSSTGTSSFTDLPFDFSLVVKGLDMLVSHTWEFTLGGLIGTSFSGTMDVSIHGFNATLDFSLSAVDQVALKSTAAFVDIADTKIDCQVTDRGVFQEFLARNILRWLRGSISSLLREHIQRTVASVSHSMALSLSTGIIQDMRNSILPPVVFQSIVESLRVNLPQHGVTI